MTKSRKICPNVFSNRARPRDHAAYLYIKKLEESYRLALFPRVFSDSSEDFNLAVDELADNLMEHVPELDTSDIDLEKLVQWYIQDNA